LNLSKICNKCGKDKPIDSFGIDARLTDSRRNSCRDCVNSRIREQKSIRRNSRRAQCSKCGLNKTLNEFKPYLSVNHPERNVCLACLDSSKTKICTRCQQDKPLTDFYDSPKKKTPKCSQCKDCYHLTQKESRDRAGDKRIGLGRLTSARSLAKYYGYASPNGVTHEEITERILRDSICDSCGRNDRRLHLEHCHVTGQVRGFVCPGCNMGIGLLESENLINCVKFLMKFKTLPVWQNLKQIYETLQDEI